MSQPYWRVAGLSYLAYANICVALARRAVKEPLKSKLLARDQPRVILQRWTKGKAAGKFLAKITAFSLIVDIFEYS
jgi:F-type H+-transporting ATPase subunit epsilon